MFSSLAYTTAGGIRVKRDVADLPFATALDDALDALDSRRGALLGSSYEYPGRYKRWSLGFVDPPLELTTRGDRQTVSIRPQGANVTAVSLSLSRSGR